MKSPRNSGIKWIAIAIVICLVFAVGIGIGTYISGKNAGKSENTSTKNTAQGNTGNVKDNVAQKDNSGDKSSTDNQDNPGKSDDSDKEGMSDKQDNEQNSSNDTEQGNSSGTQTGASTYDASIPEDDTAIHTYEYIISDCTWQEAFQDCLNRGGYLVRINSSKEYEYIRKEISSQKMTDVYFKLGGRRDSGSQDYYWVNQDNKLFGQKLNSDDSWCSDEWMGGEPSFQDGSLEEKYMDLFFYDGEKRFVWNDVPDDMLSAEPAYAGKLGYICEYE